MRPLHGIVLVLLLLMTPSAHATPGMAIHLEGEHEGGLTLHWTIDGGKELQELQLYRYVDGDLDIVPLDPTAYTYVEGEFEANVTAYWLVGLTVDGEEVWSNIYDGGCSWLVWQDEFPFLHVRPSCLPSAPVVPSSVQTQMKDAASKLVPWW